MNAPERDPGRRSLPHHPPHGAVSQSIIIYVTVNVDKRRPLLNCTDAVETILNAWREASHWLIGRYVIMPDHLHFFCAPAVTTTPLKQWMQFWRSTATRHWPRENENLFGRKISSTANSAPARATARSGSTSGRIPSSPGSAPVPTTGPGKVSATSCNGTNPRHDWRDEFHESLTEFPRLTTSHGYTRDGDSRSSSLQRFGFDHSDKDDAKYESVTLEDVKRVAAKILAENKFVISVVKPGK